MFSRHSYKPHHQASDTRAAPAPPALKSIAATAAGEPALSTLLAAVKAAELAGTLSGEGDFTVFAPTNDAFAKLPEGTIPTLLKPENKATLAGILLRHVLPNRIEAGGWGLYEMYECLENNRNWLKYVFSNSLNFV